MTRYFHLSDDQIRRWSIRIMDLLRLREWRSVLYCSCMNIRKSLIREAELRDIKLPPVPSK